MTGFTKFDPHRFLESEEPTFTPAKPAKSAKDGRAGGKTLAALATLAGSRSQSENQGASPEAFEERAAIIEYDARAPREWAEGFARRNCFARPASIPAHRWRRLIDNAGRFIDQWAAKAIALGWQAPEVFGCHPEAPTARYDMQGLVWIIGEGEVVGITDATATIRSPHGYLLTFYRVPTPVGERVALIWELGSRLPPNRGISGPATEDA